MVDISPTCRPKFSLGDLTKNTPLLRRPLSLGGRCKIDENTTELQIIYRVVGTGTRWLAGLKPGEEISVLGPLGNPFVIRPDKPIAAIVGGGVGIPPMLYTAQTLCENKQNIKTVAFCGAQTKKLLPLTLEGNVPDAGGNPTLCTREFTSYGAKTIITTDDGSCGYHGFVTQAFEKWCDESGVAADELVVYSCGPEPMMRVIGDICIKLGIECYCSLERHMGCGMGTCQSCIVKIRDDSKQGWGYKLCCSDGPAFPAELIVW